MLETWSPGPKPSPSLRISNAETLSRALQGYFQDLEREHLVLLGADSELICQQLWFCEGKTSRCDFEIQELFRILLLSQIETFWLIHNHPSGKLRPSAADLKLTERLFRAALSLGLAFVDHLIVDGRGGYLSLGSPGLTGFYSR